MDEKTLDDIIKEFKEMKMESSGVSVTTNPFDDIEHTFYYPDTVPSKEIIEDSTTVSGIQATPVEQERMIEAVDYAKTHKPYITEIEVSVSLKGAKVRIKREPAKIIRLISG